MNGHWAYRLIHVVSIIKVQSHILATPENFVSLPWWFIDLQKVAFS